MKAFKLRVLVFATGALMVAAIAQAQQASPGSKAAAAAGAQSSPAAVSRPAPQAADHKVPEAGAGKVAAAPKTADPSAQLIRDARDAGFRPAHVRGALMFCRTAIELGSNFPVRTCYNEQQTKIKIQEYQTQRNEIRAGRFLPAGMPQGCSSRTCQ